MGANNKFYSALSLEDIATQFDRQAEVLFKRAGTTTTDREAGLLAREARTWSAAAVILRMTNLTQRPSQAS